MNMKNIVEWSRKVYYHLIYRLLDGLELDWLVEGSDKYVAFTPEDQKIETGKLELINY